MPADDFSADAIHSRFEQRTPGSRRLTAEAHGVFPSGLTHDARHIFPYPIYVDRAAGSRKWDVDGHEYVDYFGGHGALLLGHNDPVVTQAVRNQLDRGTHYGSCHVLELRWAQLVQQLMPAAERIRFTSSGTEATLLAFRLARAFTSRPRILRFLTHFHGWHDHASFGVASHHDGTPTPGVLPDVAQNVALCPPNDLAAVRELLGSRDDIGGVILEPTGASWGQIPTPPAFLQDLRELTAQRGVLLIFDEVVTGFRCSPGGAQACFGIRPDLITLAKVLAGGFPGGAIAGRTDVMNLLDHEASARSGREKIAHQGTFNANPVSAAAGIAALTVIAQSDACRRATDFAARLQEAMRKVIHDERLPWIVYGTFSSFHLFLNPQEESVTPAQIEAGEFDWRKLKAASSSPVAGLLRVGMLAHGVDIARWPGGVTSAVHDDDDVARTSDALRATIQMMKSK